ncbi:DUF3742 family protein [Pseudomonas sp. zfem004]|uniref:DUF3742 family protein n=1 Tax=Pseudomonas sp. zfem004 TaxID=3078199 RepID=UPI002927E124|nr:DUF3742 family protein [Pseudomonas sp. zfem004]MDU9402580.1 DUF3742 family protein [Pseudomonas sp. zfem004]
MTAAAKHSIAFRLGRALGSMARFCLQDRNNHVRWIKRGVAFTVALLILVNSFSWILSTILTLVCLLLGLVVLSKVDISQTHSSSKSWLHSPGVPRNGPCGYGFYDMYGNFKGLSDPDDDE